jgi:hypothetical protein
MDVVRVRLRNFSQFLVRGSDFSVLALMSALYKSVGESYTI